MGQGWDAGLRLYKKPPSWWWGVTSLPETGLVEPLFGSGPWTVQAPASPGRLIRWVGLPLSHQQRLSPSESTRGDWSLPSSPETPSGAPPVGPAPVRVAQ